MYGPQCANVCLNPAAQEFFPAYWPQRQESEINFDCYSDSDEDAQDGDAPCAATCVGEALKTSGCLSPVLKTSSTLNPSAVEFPLSTLNPFAAEFVAPEPQFVANLGPLNLDSYEDPAEEIDVEQWCNIGRKLSVKLFDIWSSYGTFQDSPQPICKGLSDVDTGSMDCMSEYGSSSLNSPRDDKESTYRCSNGSFEIRPNPFTLAKPPKTYGTFGEPAGTNYQRVDPFGWLSLQATDSLSQAMSEDWDDDKILLTIQGWESSEESTSEGESSDSEASSNSAPSPMSKLQSAFLAE